MSNTTQNKIKNIFAFVGFLLLFVFVSVASVLAAPNPQINYQGKLTNQSGVAVPDGLYNMRFWLLTTDVIATTSALWTESLETTNRVQVTNGLFSVMLGDVTTLTTVDFNQALYLGVEIGGLSTSTPVWDGEMSPRKILGTVPAAFEAENAQTLDNIATTSFLRSDQADSIEATTSSPLLSIIQNGAGKIMSLFSGLSEVFTVLGNGNVGIGSTTPSTKLTVAGSAYIGGDLQLTGALKDSSNASGTLGQFLQTTGTSTVWTATSSLGIALTDTTGVLAALRGGTGLSSITANQLLIGGAGNTWSQVATSALGLGDGTFLGLSDTQNSFTANRLIFTNSGATALTDSANLVFDGTNFGIGTTTPNNLLQVYDLVNFNNTDFGTQLGYQAGKNFVTGAQYNTFVGYQAGYASSTGSTNAADYNIAIGYQSLYKNTTGSNNIANGYQSLYWNTTGYGNTANGNSALFSNRTGYNNTANGLESLFQNTTGINNTANGYQSLYNNNTGSNNTANGAQALFYNTSASNNTANGYGALFYNLIGSGNSVFGTEAGYGSFFNSFSSSTIMGYRAGYANTTGSNNLLLGYQAADNLTTGSNNIVIGYDIDLTAATLSNRLNIGNLIFGTGIDGTGTTMSTGNISIGTSTPSAKLSIQNTYGSQTALFDVASSTNAAGSATTSLFKILANGNVGIGTTTPVAKLSITGTAGTSDIFAIASSTHARLLTFTNAGYLGIGTTTPNNLLQVYDLVNFNNTDFGTQLGYQAGKNLVTGAQYNTFVGYQAGFASSTGSGSAADYNTAVGYRSLYSNTIGSFNTANGQSALYSNTTGNYNLANGERALYSNTTGSSNVANGNQSLYFNTDGSNNSVVGIYAGFSNTTGSFNTVNGSGSFYYNTIGANNTANGYQSLYYNTTGSNNTVNGYQSFYGNTTGSANSIFGTGAGYGVYNNSFSSSTIMGYRAGYANTTGSNNLLLGYQAADNLTTGSNNIVIGYDIDAVGATLSNRLNIGNLIFGTGIDGTGTTLSSGNIGIGTTTPQARLALDRRNFTGTGTIGLDQYFSTDNVTASAIQYGNNFYLNASNTATTTIIGSMIKIKDSTAFGNTVRGLEVQADMGTNTLGENTAISGFARTFGLRGTTAGDAGGTYEPAGVYGETMGTTQGNALRGYSSTITTTALLKLFQDTSTFTGTGMLMNFGNSGGSFASTTASKFIDLQNAGTSMFTVNSSGALTIGDAATTTTLLTVWGNTGIGTSSPLAKLQVFGDIRVGTSTTNGCIQNYAGTGLVGTCSSDEQLKRNIVTIATSSRSYIEALTKLDPVTYQWNDIAAALYKNNTDVTNIGLIAQNVESVFPELVSTDYKGYKQVNFTAFTFYIIQSIKEMYTEVLALKSTVLGFADKFVTKEVETEKLCVDGVCVTGVELRQLLDSVQSSIPAAAQSSDSSDEGEDEGGNEDEVTSTPEIEEVTSGEMDEVISEGEEISNEEVVTEENSPEESPTDSAEENQEPVAGETNNESVSEITPEPSTEPAPNIE